MTEPVSAEIDACAGSLKTLFARAKSEQMNRRYSPGARFNNPYLWWEAARRCLAATADPHDFIQAAFMYCGVPGGPYPQQLATGAAMKWYGEYLNAMGVNEGDDIYARTIQKKMSSVLGQGLIMAQSSKTRLRNILLDEYQMKLDFAPAFVRLLLLPKDPELQHKWARRAQAEISGNARLQETLKKLNFDLTWMHAK